MLEHLVSYRSASKKPRHSALCNFLKIGAVYRFLTQQDPVQGKLVEIDSGQDTVRVDIGGSLQYIKCSDINTWILISGMENSTGDMSEFIGVLHGVAPKNDLAVNTRMEDDGHMLVCVWCSADSNIPDVDLTIAMLELNTNEHLGSLHKNPSWMFGIANKSTWGGFEFISKNVFESEVGQICMWKYRSVKAYSNEAE